LTPREQMYVDGCLSWTEDPVVMRARWAGMATAFPDDAAAVNNAALVEWTHFGDFVAAERGFRRGLPIPHRWNYIIWHHVGYATLGQGRLDDSLAHFDESLRRGEHPAHFGLVRTHLLRGDTPAALELVTRFRGEGSVSWQADQSEAEILALVWNGNPGAALEVADRLRELAISQKFRTADRMGLRNRMLLCDALGRDDDAKAAAAALRELLHADMSAPSGGALLLPPFDALMLAAFAARKDWSDEEFDATEATRGRWERFPSVVAASRLVDGWRAMRDGRPRDALRLAREGRDHYSLYALFELEAEAYRELGEAANHRERIEQARRLLAQGF